MSLTFGPSYLDTPIESESQVTVTTWDGRLATLASPVELLPGNFITFEVSVGGRYLIKVRTRELVKEYNVKLSEDNYDPTDPRQYVDAQIAYLQAQIDAGGGGGGGGVPTSRTITAGTGLTGGGDLTANRTLSLSTASQNSLGKADTAVQPAALATKADITYVDNEINTISLTPGPKGDKGDPGNTGTAGTAATVSVGTTTTGAAGSNATVTNSGTSSAAVFNFTVPRGATGSTGTAGTAASVAVGTTTTGAAGSNASVTNSGTSSAAVLNFTVPQGAKGDKGDTGNTGTSAPLPDTMTQAAYDALTPVTGKIYYITAT